MSYRFRRVLDPPPDSLRGDLRRRLDSPREKPRAGGRSHSQVELWHLPGAGDFSSDPVLSNPLILLHEIRELGIADDLIMIINQALQARRSRSGRPRLPGHPILLYLAYVDYGETSVQRFWNHYLGAELRALCGYGDRIPSLAEVELRFAELESVAALIREVKNVVLRGAIASEPRLMDVIFIDGTPVSTSARLHHACETPCSRDRSPLTVSSLDRIHEQRWGEVREPGWGDADHESPSGRTRQPYVEVVRTRTGGEVLRGVHIAGGHRLVSNDHTSGLRSYFNTDTHWHGGYVYPAVSDFVGEALEAICFPCDVNEYDGLPTLIESLISGTKTRPLILSADRAYFTRPVFEYLTRQRIAPVVPERQVTGRPTHESWRSDRLDEDGVPRCQACGGPGDQSWPEMGLQIVRGEPVIRYKCTLPILAGCESVQAIPCKQEWLKLTALSQLRELYHSVAERHEVFEAVHHTSRRRFRVAGNEITDRLARPGIPAQDLRIAASLLLLWVRLSLRNGWLTPIVAPVTPNAEAPRRLSGQQNRRTGVVTEPGIGTERLARLLATRHRSGLLQPSASAIGEWGS